MKSEDSPDGAIADGVRDRYVVFLAPMEKSIIEIYTDGACNPNPGRGGWGVLLRYGTREKELYGGELSSTSNRMELQAAIEGLRALRWKNADVCVYTDSQYVKNGITQWVHGWKRKGWVRKKNQHVKNQDLWQELDALAMQHKIVWRWVKGHAGHPDNERADALARRGLKALRFYTR